VPISTFETLYTDFLLAFAGVFTAAFIASLLSLFSNADERMAVFQVSNASRLCMCVCVFVCLCVCVCGCAL
jgi:hypothetical protein